MTFRNKLQYFLVKKLRISNKEALLLIEQRLIKVNTSTCTENIVLKETDTIWHKNTVLRSGKKLIYIAFHKPKGIETTLNTAIKNNLKGIFSVDEKLFPVGRLDKESEGLLIMTNDGQYYNHILKNDNTIEKEYIVQVDKAIVDDFAEKMSSGIKIMGQTTLCCTVKIIDKYTFNIILKQGLNRQIRRMCYQLGYEVVFLQRIRIDNVWLGDTKSGDWREFTPTISKK